MRNLTPRVPLPSLSSLAAAARNNITTTTTKKPFMTQVLVTTQGPANSVRLSLLTSSLSSSAQQTLPDSPLSNDEIAECSNATVPLTLLELRDPLSDSQEPKEMFANEDPVIARKMVLVNQAIDQIGFTWYHFKLFCLNGFGYAVDSQIVLIQSIIAAPAYIEFRETGFPHTLTCVLFSGLFLGALFWGCLADAIGRRIAFNCTLFGCSVFCIIAGIMPNWGSLATAVLMIGFSIGGGLILDVAVFLEYLPSKYQWLLITMALWWGLGQAVTGFFAYLFLAPAKYNCISPEICTFSNNMGWRIVFWANGSLVLVLSLIRVLFFKLDETPGYLVNASEDHKVVDNMMAIAIKYERLCILAYGDLERCGVVTAPRKQGFSLQELRMHVTGIFRGKELAVSTTMLIFIWGIIGLAYPLFYVFLPLYLKSRGAALDRTPEQVWSNYLICNAAAIPGPIAAGFMANTELFGRKYTMAVSALCSMLSLIGYIFLVRDSTSEIAFSCVSGFFVNMFYAVLFAYTPEVLPLAHRATGNGLVVGLNRIMGIVSPVIASLAVNSGSAPLIVCASLFGALTIISMFLPFEPYGRRSS